MIEDASHALFPEQPRAVADVIRYEHPQIQAIVVAYLDPDQAGEVLGHFDHKVRLDIVLRVSSLNTVQPAALRELNLILEKLNEIDPDELSPREALQLIFQLKGLQT